ADYTGATLTYDKVSGNPVVYTMSITGIPNTWTATYGQNYSKSDADTYTAKVTIEIPAAEQANSKFPDPSAMSYTYGGEGNYKYISDSKCEITFDWTIEKKEVDLSAVAFEYTTDGWQSYATYSSTNPPEGDGATTYFEVRFPLTSLTNIGVTGTPTVSNYGNQFGPGDVTFDVDFTLDGNHKAKSGQNEHQMTYTMKTTGKKLAVKWKRVQLTDSNGDPVKDSLGMPYYVYELDTTDLPADALQYIKYEYYTDNGGTIGSLISGGSDVVNHKSFDYIINPTGMNANSQNPKQVFVKVVLDNVPMMGPANDVPQYVFDTTGDPSDKRITVGDNRKAVDVTATTVTSMTYKGSVNIADAYEVAINTPHVVLQPNQYTVALYLGADLINADATAQDYSQLDAGKYTLKFTLASSMDAQYALTSDSLSFEIKPKEITVPTVKAGVTFTFNGLDQQLEAQLDGWDDTYMEWDLASVHEAYHANKYTAIIKLKDEFVGNYIFVLPNDNGKALGKKAVKALVDGEENLPVLSGDKTTATIPWKIEKYVYDTTTKNAWNFTKDGASLSFNGVPATIKALTLGDNPRLVFETAYFDLDGNPLTGEITIKGGDKYKVAAYLDPNCADANDIEFKGQAYDPMLQMTTSPQAAYTVPKSASAAFLGNLKDAMTKVYAGLPLWAWLLIALALLILLIIIIVVACKRRKTKEEKEEIKARKEEERLRKEEEKQRREEEREAERQRREEERRLQQEKLEAERELAKAKQEAELEKIRAQVQAQAGAGMATMAVQQQPQQQIPPQPVQQVQSVDNELLKEMRQQMAELRADNKATQAQLQAMQNNQQQQQPMQMPMPQPMYQQYPQYPMYQQMPMGMPNYGGGNDMALARMEAQLNAMQAEQRARYDAEQRIELAAMRAEQHVDRDSRHSVDLAAMREHINGYNYNRIPDYSNQAYNQQPNSVEALGAIVAAALKNISTPAPAQPVAELPQQTEASAPSEVRYPSDAVITTTTTVDTTKNKPITRERDDGRIFDSDGFYDPLE
ncbi:MAG: hypothetical protein K2N22_00495, partial [Clostridia bacterium]|nr:hypothetical protein [Clostridia bacterium]